MCGCGSYFSHFYEQGFTTLPSTFLCVYGEHKYMVVGVTNLVAVNKQLTRNNVRKGYGSRGNSPSWQGGHGSRM